MVAKGWVMDQDFSTRTVQRIEKGRGLRFLKSDRARTVMTSKLI